MSRLHELELERWPVPPTRPVPLVADLRQVIGLLAQMLEESWAAG